MPVPQQWTETQDEFRISEDLAIHLQGEYGDRLTSYANRILIRMRRHTGLSIEPFFVSEEPLGNERGILVNSARIGKLELGEDESYTLTTSKNNIEIIAATDIGAMRGLETLFQLIQADAEGFMIPGIQIEDAPRFPWRGLMIDISRHFQPIEVIKRNIDAMAMVKLNVLHLHITDDHGFRIESKVFPEFHEQASDGQYFTQDQMRGIIQYASDRGIRVMPEFDLPGHASSWLMAMPEIGSKEGTYQLQRKSGIFDPTLDPTNEKTYEVLASLFKEMFDLFPDAYFHIGGDENEGKHWNENEQIQQFMKDHSIADNHELQAYFNQQILKMLEANDKIMVGWDEILHPNIPTSAVIHSWRGKDSLASSAKKGYRGILSNGYYIDLMRSVEGHYLNDPISEEANLTEEEEQLILGGEATMWSELVTPLTIDSRIWPRTAAIAERFWSPASVNSVDDMFRRLRTISLQLELVGSTHLRNRDMLMRQLTNGQPTTALETIIGVVEPMKGYTRNPNGDLYTVFSPLVLVADVANVDAPDALYVRNIVNKYISQQDESTYREVVNWLAKWEGNHEEFLKLLPKAPELREILSTSEALSNLAEVTLELIESDDPKGKLTEVQAALEASTLQDGRVEIRIQPAIQPLVDYFINK